MATRRQFIGGALASIAAGDAAAAALTPAGRLAPALDAIRAYSEAHRRHFGLPALALSVATSEGFSTTIDVGLADPPRGRAIGPTTLFEIGSISKSMTAAVVHQLAAEGRLRLDADVRRLLPEAPWPDVAITVQQLLDHVSGLPDDAPAFPQSGRLWLGFRPGEHWSYSNTGYDLLGLIAERLERRPLARILRERIFAPLGMAQTRGAILSSDRPLYAVAYGAIDQDRPLVPGTPLTEAPWVDVTFGAGCVASTTGDMVRYLRSLASAAAGRGGLGLSPGAASLYAGHDVATDDPDLRYGNGLMKRQVAGRTFLHHTGGMVGYSSSFHVDPATGTGAFASSTISGFAEYRPRLVTLFAVRALDAARQGRAIPAAPPFEPPIAKPADFAGRYTGPGGSLEVKPGATLVLSAAGGQAPLRASDEDSFTTAHRRFGEWPLRFLRDKGRVIAIGWGPETFVREGTLFVPAPSDPKLALLAGRYQNDNPWYGVARVAERSGRLWMGGATPLTPLGDGSWRLGDKDWSPERVRFESAVAGRPRTLLFSAVPFERRDV